MSEQLIVSNDTLFERYLGKHQKSEPFLDEIENKVKGLVENLHINPEETDAELIMAKLEILKTASSIVTNNIKLHGDTFKHGLNRQVVDANTNNADATAAFFKAVSKKIEDKTVTEEDVEKYHETLGKVLESKKIELLDGEASLDPVIT